MIKHKWEDSNKCIVCGIEKHIHKEFIPSGQKFWIVNYHREGEIVRNQGCIKEEKNKEQLKLF